MNKSKEQKKDKVNTRALINLPVSENDIFVLFDLYILQQCVTSHLMMAGYFNYLLIYTANSETFNQ